MKILFWACVVTVVVSTSVIGFVAAPGSSGGGPLTCVQVVRRDYAKDHGEEGACAIAADGRYLYQTILNHLVVYRRDPSDGKLEFVQAILNEDLMQQETALAVSEQAVYTPATATRLPDVIRTFARDNGTGGIVPVPAKGPRLLDGVFDVERLAVSTDGKHLYATCRDQGLLVACATNGGQPLSLIQVFRDDEAEKNATVALPAQAPWVKDAVITKSLLGATGVALSRDQRNVYALSSDNWAIIGFERDATTGQLTEIQAIEDRTTLGRQGLGGANYVATSPNDRSVYITSPAGISVFERDAATGLLKWVQTIHSKLDRIPTLHRALCSVVSHDGAYVFVAATGDSRSQEHGAISVFKRDTTTGMLEYDSAIRGPDVEVACDLCLSPDGRQLYAVTGRQAVVVFQVNQVPNAKQ
jgi:6-phosphogluconolactonase (cycloisomerase 2 family)